MVEGFTFFVSYYEGLKQVPEEYRLETYEAIMDYVFEGVEPSDDASPWVQIVFKMAKPTIDSGLTSKENGKKGGAPKGNKNAKKCEETTEDEDENNLKTTKTTPLVFQNNPPCDSETTNKNKNKNKNENKNKNKNENSEEELKDYCTEPPMQASVISMPLNDGSEYPVFDNAIKEWEKLYPAVDVPQELRNMRAWLLSNRTKRKTKSGIERFINGWLAKEQNRGGRAAPGRSAPKNRSPQDSFASAGRDLNGLVE